MPPRARKNAPPEAAETDALLLEPAGEAVAEADTAPTAKATEPDEAVSGPGPEVVKQPCRECFPQGWPAEDATSVGCGHGSWQR